MNPDTASILCVEPSAEAQAVLQEILAPHRTVFARNAYEALRELHASTWDSYVLECWLPDLPGVRVCREIRKIDPHGPVMFCTGAARHADRECAFRAGASAYVCKPIDPPAMVGKLRVLLALAALESARAKQELVRVLHEEFARRTDDIRKRTGATRGSARRAMERICRSKAAAAFISAGGTRAYLERYWATAFDAAWASYSQPGDCALICIPDERRIVGRSSGEALLTR